MVQTHHPLESIAWNSFYPKEGVSLSKAIFFTQENGVHLKIILSFKCPFTLSPENDFPQSHTEQLSHTPTLLNDGCPHVREICGCSSLGCSWSRSRESGSDWGGVELNGLPFLIVCFPLCVAWTLTYRDEIPPFSLSSLSPFVSGTASVRKSQPLECPYRF